MSQLIEDEPDFDEDCELEEEFECGFILGEGCLMAGTEDCDFECPYRTRLIASPYYPNCTLFGHEANDPDDPDY
jgi:hypothetical protein